MANRLKGEVSVECGGKTLIFRLGINELIGLQDEWGMKDDDEKFLIALDEKRSLKRRRSLVKAALIYAQPDITDEQAGDVVTELGLPKIDEVLMETLAWALPPKEPSRAPAKGKGEAASPGTLPS